MLLCILDKSIQSINSVANTVNKLISHVISKISIIHVNIFDIIFVC